MCPIDSLCLCDRVTLYSYFYWVFSCALCSSALWEWLCLCLCLCLYRCVCLFLFSTLSPIFLTQFPQALCESDTPNWQRASHTNDSIWRPHLLSNKYPCLWSWVPGCNTLNHIKFKFKSPNLKNFGCLCLCIQFSLKFPIYILSI